jgi:hypothetical protein
MKQLETYAHCEWCDKQITIESPPSRERYESAEISIGKDSTMLLPGHVVSINEKKNRGSAHAIDIGGIYCCPACLIARINAIIKVEP